MKREQQIALTMKRLVSKWGYINGRGEGAACGFFLSQLRQNLYHRPFNGCISPAKQNQNTTCISERVCVCV